MAGRHGIRIRSADRAAARAALSEWGAVSMMAKAAPASLAAAKTWGKRAAWAETTAGRQSLICFSMVPPTRGACLRVKVDDGRRFLPLFCGDGQMDSQGRLACPAFLGDDGDCLHVKL